MSVGVAVAQPAHSADLFATTRELEVLSQFGTPCSVLDFVAAGTGTERLWGVEGGPELVWPTSPADHAAPAAGWLGDDPETRIPIFASVVPDDAAESLLSHHAGSWKPIGTVASIAGERLGSVWRSEDGSVFLPFDPDEVQVNLLSERYRDVLRSDGRDWRRFAMRAYYRVRALLPKAVQIWLRRRYAPLQARSAFPRWPVEAGLHDLWDFLYSLLESILGEPVPRIAAWPNGASWALVLTHDVESSTGLRTMDALLEVERENGFRSSWNFVPRRDYEVSADRIQSLAADGFEVGVHGLHHDGRDLESLRDLAGAPAGHARRGGSVECGRFSLPFDAPQLGPDAATWLRLRLLLSRYRSIRAPGRRVLHVAALLQRRDGRASADDDPGSHAVRDPSPSG